MSWPSVLAPVATLAALAGCSNSGAPIGPDGAPSDGAARDSGHGDASSDASGDAPADAPGIPAPPVLGAQLDRRGRPLIREALIGVFASDTIKAAARDIYDQAPDPATWATTTLRTNVTIQAELEANLAVFDAIDRSLMVQNRTLKGCGNALKYGEQLGGAYQGAAQLFADDQLYVDTSLSSCGVYFDIELQFVQTALVHGTCGGRTPIHDVVDVTYSVLAGGTEALLSEFRGAIGDGVTAHPDVTATFPFLGPPH